MKKLISILCAGAMLLSLAACGAKADTTYVGQTITGKVTALEGTSVTLALGELTEDAAPGGDSQQPPEMSSDGQTGDQPTGTPPENRRTPLAITRAASNRQKSPMVTAASPMTTSLPICRRAAWAAAASPKAARR